MGSPADPRKADPGALPDGFPAGRSEAVGVCLFGVSALAFGPAYAWVLFVAARHLPWTRGIAIDLFEADPGPSMPAFCLACAGIGLALRRRIVASPRRQVPGLALVAALAGGPVTCFLRALLSLFLVPEQIEGGGGGFALVTGAAIGCLLLGAGVAVLLLPISFPLTWLAIGILRRVGRLAG